MLPLFTTIDKQESIYVGHLFYILIPMCFSELKQDFFLIHKDGKWCIQYIINSLFPYFQITILNAELQI